MTAGVEGGTGLSERFHIATPDGRVTAICMEGSSDGADSSSGNYRNGELRFKFADDTTIYRYPAAPGGNESCFDSAIFSPSWKWVRLQSGSTSSFEIVSIDHLKNYLAGGTAADDVVGVSDTIRIAKDDRTPIARVHDSFRWEGDSAFIFAVWDADPVYYRHVIGGATVSIPAPSNPPPHSR